MFIKRFRESFSELTEHVVRVLDCRDLGSSRNLLACIVDLELVGRMKLVSSSFHRSCGLVVLVHLSNWIGLPS